MLSSLMSASPPPPPLASSESAEGAATRFVLELEFVSALADPEYCHYIVAHFVGKPGFLAYLRYLCAHWSTPPYARHLRYPAGLLHLRLLAADESFRASLADAAWAAGFKALQLDAWRAAAAADGDVGAPR